MNDWQKRWRSYSISRIGTKSITFPENRRNKTTMSTKLTRYRKFQQMQRLAKENKALQPEIEKAVKEAEETPIVLEKEEVVSALEKKSASPMPKLATSKKTKSEE